MGKFIKEPVSEVAIINQIHICIRKASFLAAFMAILSWLSFSGFRAAGYSSVVTSLMSVLLPVPALLSLPVLVCCQYCLQNP